MPELFRLVEEKFSEKDQEKQWTYACLFAFVFKKWTITEITITDHPWKKKGRQKITKELILNLLKDKIHGIKRMKPRTRHNIRDIYVREKIFYQGKEYRLVFWFKDGTTNHLWIRNCYERG